MSEKSSKAQYITVNLIGVLFSVLFALNSLFHFLGLAICVLTAGIVGSIVGYERFLISLAIFMLLIIINIMSFAFVSSNKPFAGIPLSIFFGSVGALLGSYCNEKYKYTKIAKVSFNVHIWIIVWYFIIIYTEFNHF